MEAALAHRESRPLLRLLVAAFELYRSRRGLAELDEDRLRDIGLTRAEAQAEAQRPIWGSPAHWVTGS